MIRQKITPCLWFDGKAEEAAKFYASVFPDSDICRITPGPDGNPLVVVFRLAGQMFLGLNGGPMFQFTEALSLSIDCETQAEVDHYWEKLSEGGSGGHCGWLKDRYGVSWQVVPTALPELLSNPDPAKAGRVMQKMLTMNKLDIQALRDAADGK